MIPRRFFELSILGAGFAALTSCGDSGSSSGSGGGGAGTTTSTSQTGGSGGGCGIPECFAPVECVEQCGGAIVQSGCCPCEGGLIDVYTCGTGGAGGGTGGAG